MLSLYSLGHFLVDFVCAWTLLGRFAGTDGWIAAALFYNFCAFALQMPLGILADRMGRDRVFAALGAFLVCLGVIPLGYWWTVLLLGVGNALYHVGGGRETMLSSDRLGPLGVFVAPGALGIFLGGLTRGRLLFGVPGAVALVLVGVVIAFTAGKKEPTPREMAAPDGQSLRTLALVFVVVLIRSAVGMCAAAPWKTGIWIWIGAVLGASGKALGGFAADRFGLRKAAACSLLASALLFLLPHVPIAGAAAGLLFQMSMPMTLGRAGAAVPGGEGFSFGLLTFALFLGFLLTQWGITFTPAVTAILSAVSALLLLAVPKGGTKCNI